MTAALREACTLIRQDMEQDVREFDGLPLAGKTVATIHGNLAAAVSALAGMIAALDERIDQAIEDHIEDRPHIYADGSTS